MKEPTFSFQGHEAFERFSFELDRDNVKHHYIVSDSEITLYNFQCSKLKLSSIISNNKQYNYTA